MGKRVGTWLLPDRQEYENTILSWAYEIFRTGHGKTCSLQMRALVPLPLNLRVLLIEIYSVNYQIRLILDGNQNCNLEVRKNITALGNRAVTGLIILLTST